MKHRILTISVNTPNVLLFNLHKHIYQFKCKNKKFWSFKTTNELVIVRNGTLSPSSPVCFPSSLNALRKSIIQTLFKFSAAGVETSLRSLFKHNEKSITAHQFFKCSTRAAAKSSKLSQQSNIFIKLFIKTGVKNACIKWFKYVNTKFLKKPYSV